MALQTLALVVYFLYVLFSASSIATSPRNNKQCKPIPGDTSWPSPREWAKLNTALSGRLLSPPPPGGVCHPTHPAFDLLKCPAVLVEWPQNSFHTNNPISNLVNNWNNDSCIPLPGFPCSGAGYPVYVINATSPSDVKKGVDFARKTGVRLIVKGTGHDFLGRSQAPNALSIWTRHIGGLKVYSKGAFKPDSCSKIKVTTAAITVAAGVPMIEINAFADLHNLTVVSGGAATVGLGGYLSGGGHGAISPIFGLAADNVLEISLVTPRGDIITANECQHSDLFWALRGGGGPTFGIMTSVTIRAFPSFRYATVQVLLATPVSENTEPFFNALTKIFTLLPPLADKGISGYTETAINHNASYLGIPFLVNGFTAIFNLPILNPTTNMTSSLLAELTTLVAAAKKAGGEDEGVYWLSNLIPSESASFYEHFKIHNGPENGGQNFFLSSRLLSKRSVNPSNTVALRTALEGAAQSGGISAYLVSGPGVHDMSKIPGGGNAVNPAWRKAYLHVLLGVRFPPLNEAEKKRQHSLLTNTYARYLRELEPESGSYVNEADPEEPGYQQAFWGSNYERLSRIQKRVDPEGVLWHAVAVGGEAWDERVGRDGRVRVCKL